MKNQIIEFLVAAKNESLSKILEIQDLINREEGQNKCRIDADKFLVGIDYEKHRESVEIAKTQKEIYHMVQKWINRVVGRTDIQIKELFLQTKERNFWEFEKRMCEFIIATYIQ